MQMFSLLNLMVQRNASDMFLSVGAPPHLKIDGVTIATEFAPFKPGEIKVLSHSMMTEQQILAFDATMECNLSVTTPGIGRFRYNMYVQKGEVAMVVRYIRDLVPSLEALGLPPVARELVMLKRGLVLIVGAAGSGKSTTLASMVDYRNQNATGHILCIEDPIEFVHAHKRCIIDQREVGVDTHSFEEALRNALREAPDVIVIGEIRDRVTMRHALSYAETGHLCISTLHANNANQAIERISSFFPEDAQRALRMDLSLNLKGVLSQRLVPGVTPRQALAVEVLLASAHVSDLILKGQVDALKNAMGQNIKEGMQTFDQSLFDLYCANKISLEQALLNADSRTDLALRVRLTHPTPSPTGPTLDFKPHPSMW